MFGTCDNCKLFIEKDCDTYSNYELDENKRCKNFEALKKRKCDDCFYFNKNILYCKKHRHHIGNTKNYDCLAYKKDNTPKDWEKVKFVPEIIMEEYNKMKTNTNHDPVNHPNHYTSGGIECIDCIKAVLGENFIGFLIGNVIKYCYRYKNKNGIEDLKKSKWYLEKAINELEEQENNK